MTGLQITGLFILGVVCIIILTLVMGVMTYIITYMKAKAWLQVLEDNFNSQKIETNGKEKEGKQI